jgi:hypothetical protein
MLLAMPSLAAPPEAPWDPEARARFRAIWPVDEAADAALVEELGGGFEVHHSDHFAVAHARNEAAARYRSQILESTYAAFTTFVSESGLPLEIPDALLSVVLFPTRSAFRAHVGDVDVSDRVDGLYVEAANRAYFFHGASRSEGREASRAARRASAELAELKREIRSMDDDDTIMLREGHREWRRYDRSAALRVIAAEERRISSAHGQFQTTLGQLGIETMVHEGIHLLSFNMGLFDRGTHHPVWITEGLATFFEPSFHGFLHETGAIHWRRVKQLRRAHARGASIDLERLLCDDGLFRSDDEASEAYDEAWSLTHFLATERRAGLTAYLRAVGGSGDREAAGDVCPGRIATFEAAFGAPLAEIEPRWREHVASFDTADAVDASD